MNISVERLDKMKKGNEPHILLDIRENEELEIASIRGALHIPMNLLPDQLNKLRKDIPIVVMCHSGGRSAHVQSWLYSNGYQNAVNLEGGINAWSELIDPKIPMY